MNKFAVKFQNNRGVVISEIEIAQRDAEEKSLA